MGGSTRGIVSAGSAVRGDTSRGGTRGTRVGTSIGGVGTRCRAPPSRPLALRSTRSLTTRTWRVGESGGSGTASSASSAASLSNSARTFWRFALSVRAPSRLRFAFGMRALMCVRSTRFLSGRNDGRCSSSSSALATSGSLVSLA